MPSEIFVQGCGVAATVLLVVMLLPQVYALFKTRRAEDLSHVFLGLMTFGLIMLSFYNVFLELWVFFVAALLQLVLCMVTQAGKVWADRYQRRLQARTGARLARALSVRSGARLELAKFVLGSSAPFPLLSPSPTHTAQHLLLDVRLPEPEQAGAAAGAEAGSNAAAAGSRGGSNAAAGFAVVAELLRGALASAGLLRQHVRQVAPDMAAAREGRGSTLATGSMSLGTGAQQQREAEGEPEAESVMLECHDGYAALVWHADTCSLSVDCLAVAAQSMHSMASAAEAFCSALAERFPGCRISASTLGRLPL